MITRMYAAYASGDRAAVDAGLDPEATIWDSAAAPLLLGRRDLNRLRDERTVADGGPAESALRAYDPVVDVFGDVAVVRYWLRVDFASGPDGLPMRPELVRNTAVLRGDAGGRWLIVHLHEDVHQQGGLLADDT
ncbi:nuclear transport factor 2 family protein [Streptomyces sp. CB02959]|uniref:nuclear transport factor 2 family protein n=1 Tax=Streptomyces sp. CB02959 TaxID=2020330 RepID=UPI002152181C|nr:nuclear transport factor 2 family protein [Streptomyces sp. CB02959]